MKERNKQERSIPRQNPNEKKEREGFRGSSKTGREQQGDRQSQKEHERSVPKGNRNRDLE